MTHPELPELSLETRPALLERAARIAGRLEEQRGGGPIDVIVAPFELNAFSLPGRRVVVSSAVLEPAASDELVAFVIAHEMAHHDLGHCGADVGAVRGLVELVARVSLTLDDELAADRAAMALCRRAGFMESRLREAFAELTAAEEWVGGGPPREVSSALVKLGIVRASARLGDRGRTLWSFVAPIASPVAAPPGLAATRMVVWCTSCDVRFPPCIVCPRCGSDAVLDLRGDARTHPAVPKRPHPVIGWPRDERTLRGLVRLTRATRSPLGTACGAWRLRGKACRGVIDDAGVGAFDLVVDGRIVAQVLAGDALVDLGPGPRPRSRPVDARLEAFLRERGCTPRRGHAWLSETVLLDGDEAEVTGPTEEILVAEGYRESTTVPCFRDWPAIRKVEERG